jgi:hypothetical protein
MERCRSHGVWYEPRFHVGDGVKAIEIVSLEKILVLTNEIKRMWDWWCEEEKLNDLGGWFTSRTTRL